MISSESGPSKVPPYTTSGMSTGSKRVLQVVAAFPPYYSGTGTVALHNSIELAKRGYKVCIATPAHNSPSVYERQGVEVHSLQMLFRIGLAGIFAGTGRLCEFDVLHLHLPFLLGGEQAMAMALRRKTPAIVTYHQDLNGRGLVGPIFGAYSRASLSRLLERAAAIVVPTLDFARHSRLSDKLFASQRIVEIPNGVDTNFYLPGPPRRTLPVPWTPTDISRSFLFVGALDRAHYFKGVDVLLHAVAQMDSSDGRLIIIGDGDLRYRYQRLALKLGISHRVYFSGTVSPEVLPDYYRATLCTVLPSVNSGEIFGIVLLEAMACGRPTIATNLPGVRTVVDHKQSGLLVPPGDMDALADAMESLLRSPVTVTDRMGKKGREKAVKRYDWSVIGNSLHRLYAEVLT